MYSLKYRGISLSCLQFILFPNPLITQPCILALTGIHMHKKFVVSVNKSFVEAFKLDRIAATSLGIF
jgi:hypothetical protein